MFLTVTFYFAAFIFWFAISALVAKVIAQRGYGYLVAMAALVPICVAVMLAMVLSLPKKTPDWVVQAIGFPAILVMIIICLMPMYFASKRKRLTGPLLTRFRKMESFSGKRVTDVVEMIGPYQSRTKHPEGSLIQWIQEGSNIAIVFDEDGYFKYVQHEASL